MKGAIGLGLLVVAVVTLVIVSAYGALEGTRYPGVSALHAAGGRVYVGVGHEVLVADESGRTLGTLDRAPGRPWEFDAIVGVATDPQGRIVVGDVGRGELVRFEPGLPGGTVLPLKPAPLYAFEVQPWSGGYLVGATPDHSLRIVSPQGERVVSRHVRYPNGLSLLPSGFPGAPATETFVLVETGHGLPRAFDTALRPVRLPAVTALREYRHRDEPRPPGPAGFPELLDLSVDPQGALIASLCRNMEGECSFVRVDGRTGAVEVVGDLGFIGAELPESAQTLLLGNETTVTSRGTLLAASPRLSGVYAFTGPEGRPPGGFCTRCTTDELEARAVAQDALDRDGADWTNGTRVTLFGDETLRARYLAQRRARVLYERVEQFSRQGVLLLALVLLVLLIVLRQTGRVSPERLQARLELLASRLVQPHRGTLAATAALVGTGVLAGGLAGFLMLHAAGAFGGAVAGGMLLARFVATPFLLRRRDARAASDAFALFLGERAHAPLALAPGEFVLWSVFGRTHRPARKVLTSDVREALDVDDPLEALEYLAPRLTLVTRTNRRLVVAETSVFGAPVDQVATMELLDEDPGPAGRIVLDDRAETRTYEAPHLPREAAAKGLRFTVDATRWHCDRCRAPLGTCAHGRSRPALELALACLFPGLGQLAQGRFGRARLLVLVALGFALAALAAWFPQHFGTVPPDVAAWGKPLVAYLGTLGGGALDVWHHTRRLARRAQGTSATAEREEVPAFE